MVKFRGERMFRTFEGNMMFIEFEFGKRNG